MLGSNSSFGNYVIIYLVFSFLMREMATKPMTPTTAVESTEHIVNYVNQMTSKAQRTDYAEFDFEPINNASNIDNMDMPISYQLSDRLIDGTPDGIDIGLDTDMTKNFTNDSAIEALNTLDDLNEIYDKNEQHESNSGNDTEEDAWRRVKMSIPVLKPVQDLLNTVRDGNLNHSRVHTHSHSIGGDHGGHPNGTESAAIETEEERETVIESNGFNLLEVLGTIAGMVWGFFTNIQKLFAASSGSASAASSSSSSGSS